jgi:hypothetical protein
MHPLHPIGWSLPQIPKNVLGLRKMGFIKASYEIWLDRKIRPHLLATGLAHYSDREIQNHELEKPNECGNRGYLVAGSETIEPSANPASPPIVRRFVVCCGLGLAGLLVALCGGDYLDDGRWVFGSVLISVGLLLGAGAFLLLWATLVVPRTWGWLL